MMASSPPFSRLDKVLEPFLTPPLDGYSRAAFLLGFRYGLSFGKGKTDFMVEYVLVVNRNDRDRSEVLVELMTWNEDVLRPIDPSIIKEFAKDSEWSGSIVERDGRAFIKGFTGVWHGQFPRISIEMAYNTQAHWFVRAFGEPLAVAVGFPGKVNTIDDAWRIRELMRDIHVFRHEMAGTGFYSNRIATCQCNLNDMNEQLRYFDERVREQCEIFNDAKKELEKVGLSFDIDIGDRLEKMV